MKKFDVKKLLVFILIIAVLIIAGFFIFKMVNKENLSNEDKQNVENSVITYFLNLTNGYSTIYGGLDVLYSYDKTSLGDLKEQEIIFTAVNYLEKSEINYSISADYMSGLKESGKYKDLNNYRIYKGESVRQAVKDLFGLDSIPSNPTPVNFLYNISYDSNYDCYLISENNIENNNTNEATMDFSIISTEKKEDKLETIVAIAYVYNDNGNIMYLKDAEGTSIVAENLDKKEFPKDKIDEFTKYKFTLKENSDKKYVFESVEKIN